MFTVFSNNLAIALSLSSLFGYCLLIFFIESWKESVSGPVLDEPVESESHDEPVESEWYPDAPDEPVESESSISSFFSSSWSFFFC